MMTERFTAMGGRVRGYFYDDIQDFETARVLLRIHSNLLPGPPEAYPTVALGFRYFDSMYRSRNGHLHMPTSGDPFRGRHFVVAIDHDDMRTIKFINSWGGHWGDHGYGFIDEEYFNAHVETVFARWSSVTGPSRTMTQWLDRAQEEGIGYPLNLLACWPAPNVCTIFDAELQGRAHSVVHWQVVSLERTLPVDAYELRNGARIIGRLHVEHGGDTSVISEMFVLPAFRRKGYGRFLEQLAGERASDHGAIELQAWLRRGDHRSLRGRCERARYGPGVRMGRNPPRAADAGCDGNEEAGVSADGEQIDVGETAAASDDPATKQSEAGEIITGQVIIDPGNPFDFEEEEIAELIQELQASEPDAEVLAHFREETEYGGALMEVLHVWTSVADFVNQNWETIGIVATVVNWLRKRWQRDKAANPERPRPRSALIYDQEQRLVFSIVIDLPTGEPVVEQVDSARHGHRRPTGGRRKGSEIYDHERDEA
jgi:GNAT superfamily N-acetyltransferase